VDEAVERFCQAASDRDILSEQQCAVLCDISAEDATLRDFVDLAAFCRPAAGAKLEALEKEVAAQTRPAAARRGAKKAVAGTTAPASSDDTKAAPDLPDWRPSPELEWFCFFCVEEGLLTAKDCIAIVSNMAAASDPLGFAQIVIDTGMCKEPVKVRDLVEKAAGRARTGEAPPSSVLAR